MIFHSKRKFGEAREDGYRFVSMRHDRLKKDGTYGEDWRSPEGFEKHVQDGKKYKKRIYDLISKLMNEEKMKHGCAHCGYKGKPEALDHHHVNPSDKTIAVASHWRTSYKQFEKMKKEWKKCIVLCANCHRIETKRILNANK
jgi:5-methylcytosine-specific restriction endonuclease McrA